MQKPQVLKGHVSEETAYVVDDYPAGFNKRCRIKFWIETNNHGQRVCTMTTDPNKPGEVWNKPKKLTYTDLYVLYIDPSNGHVKHAGISHHATKTQVETFLNTYGEENFTDEYSCKTLELMKQYRVLQMARYSAEVKPGEIPMLDTKPVIPAPGEVLTVE